MLSQIRVDIHTLISLSLHPPDSISLSLSLSLSALSRLSLIDILSDVLQYLDDIKSGRIPSPPPPTSSTTTIIERAATTPAQKISSPPTLTSPSIPVIKMDSKASPILSYVDIPVDEVQRSRARQMVQSKATVPHVYASASCRVQRLVELAKGLGDNDGSGRLNC